MWIKETKNTSRAIFLTKFRTAVYQISFPIFKNRIGSRHRSEGIMVTKILCLALFSLAFCQVISADDSIPVKNDVSIEIAPVPKAGDSTEMEKSRLQMMKDFFAAIARKFIEMIKSIGSGIKDVFSSPGNIFAFIKTIPRRIWQFIVDVKDYIVGLVGPRVTGLAINAVDTAAEGAFKLGDKYIEKNAEAEQISSDFDDLESEEPLP